ncbi:hypothetical protein EV356DRAFT_176149 [Viridothelium virens]|uniref:Serine hydrolase domain-containing protein n=1 Tax=Viridothelium virens TaxID=1048519 RepID=A0A6A6H8W9_VIRVR|nr:hypothetical protein EV356DRAFT_176149 [Viridothelium virens]
MSIKQAFTQRHKMYWNRYARTAIEAGRVLRHIMLNFLCLHAAFGNPKVFEDKIGPFFSELEEQGKVKLHYPCGPYEMSLECVNRIKGRDTSMWIFPDPPNYCWTNDANVDVHNFGVAQPGLRVTAAAVDDAIEYITEHIIPTMGPFDGVVAYSESGMVATRLAQKHKSIKCAVIFCGVASTDKSMTESDFAPKNDAERIPIHSLHIYGLKDMFKESAVIMHSYYAQDKARMLQHSKGHTVPSDPRNQQKIRKCVADFLTAVQFDVDRM